MLMRPRLVNLVLLLLLLSAAPLLLVALLLLESSILDLASFSFDRFRKTLNFWHKFNNVDNSTDDNDDSQLAGVEINNDDHHQHGLHELAAHASSKSDARDDNKRDANDSIAGASSTTAVGKPTNSFSLFFAPLATLLVASFVAAAVPVEL